MFFRKCRVCAEKSARLADAERSAATHVRLLEARIIDLKREADFLRKLALPDQRKNSALPVLHLEQDKLLNGDGDITEYSSKDGVLVDTETPDFKDPQAEADALLTGNF